MRRRQRCRTIGTGAVALLHRRNRNRQCGAIANAFVNLFPVELCISLSVMEADCFKRGSSGAEAATTTE